MITVKEVLAEYAVAKNITDISKRTLTDLGRFISHHFRNYYTAKHPEGVIKDAGLIKVFESDKAIVVAGYPVAFRKDMLKRIDVFFKEKALKEAGVQKDKKEEVVVPEKRVRKRIPVKKPVS